MRILKSAGRILSILLTLALAFILACNVYLIAARSITGQRQPTVFGYSSAVVISGSMSGTIEVNDMIIARSAESYGPGDIISFDTGSSIVTHRILEVTPEGFITKGDANNTADIQPVTPDQVVGKVVLVIPGVGSLIEGLRTPLGMMCITLLGITLIVVPSLLEGSGESKKQGGKYRG